MFQKYLKDACIMISGDSSNHIYLITGFRKGYSTESCLIAMIGKCKKVLDKRQCAGALLTDLSKAFDCLNHELLIAKLEAYDFDILRLILFTVILWEECKVLKLITLLVNGWKYFTVLRRDLYWDLCFFNIFLNDIFLVVDETEIANYADDNTPYSIDSNVDVVLLKLNNDMSILMKWFNETIL